jgi:UDP-glucose 4-epimerase
MGRRVLVTGAARTTGRRLVGALAEAPEVERVVAVDDFEPQEPFPGKVEHLAVDLRSPALVRAVQSAGIDTCVHLGVTAEPAGPQVDHGGLRGRSRRPGRVDREHVA